MKYLVDSYAWIEYFIASKKGEKMILLFSDERNSFLIIDACLAEIKGWSLKNHHDFEELYKIIKSNSEIISLSEKDWINAGKLRFEERKIKNDFGLIDSAILLKQKELDCYVISGDKHFKDKKKIIFLS